MYYYYTPEMRYSLPQFLNNWFPIINSIIHGINSVKIRFQRYCLALAYFMLS